MPDRSRLGRGRNDRGAAEWLGGGIGRTAARSAGAGAARCRRAGTTHIRPAGRACHLAHGVQTDHAAQPARRARARSRAIAHASFAACAQSAGHHRQRHLHRIDTDPDRGRWGDRIRQSRLDVPGPLQEDKIVSIPPRSGVMDIADLLNREGVMDVHRLVFIGGVFALKARSELKAGEYLFPKRASVKDVIETIVEGKVVQHQITVPEGLTSEQIVARLLEDDVLSGNVKDVPREGSLLPDGYHFNRGFTREQMIQRMRQAQDRLVREVWERRNPDLPLKTPDQLIVLASIIEKETSKPEERTRIAAVLTNRLKQKMKLQSDPTIIYGRIRQRDARPSAHQERYRAADAVQYLCHRRPAAGADRQSGRASSRPPPIRRAQRNFILSPTSTGGHAFAETYDQHLKNVARLRASAPELKGEAPASEAQPPASASPPRTAPAQRSKRSAGGSSRNAGAAQ